VSTLSPGLEVQKTQRTCRQAFARRTMLNAGLAWAALKLATPFAIQARGEEPVRIGMVEPLSGVYAKLAEAEVEGARVALEEVNARGGILGRQAQLLIEDSTNSIAIGIAKTRQLIDRDRVDFIVGDLNSSIALAMMRVTSESRKLHIVTGAHVDAITGQQCSWNVFRVCNTTAMEANAIADTLIRRFGKKWYFLTPGYAYGYALQAAFERRLRDHDGTWTSATLPLGTVDYSEPLQNARNYRPDVLIDIMGGDDQVNSLEQIMRFGLGEEMTIGGALFEMESILAVSDAARTGWWTMEWWWDQPDPLVNAFNEAIRRRTGKPASARNWFGYVAVHTLAHIANQEKSLAAVALARALQGRALPGEITLAGASASFGVSDHQLMSTILVGEVHPPRRDAFDVFTARASVRAEAAREGASGCTLAFPS
jgi:branched-chain amino acid transport system substrate-binding protein